MKLHYIVKENHAELVLFFAGWGMDERPFADYRPLACDFMIVYDYRTLDFDFLLLEEYTSIRLVAWSMGVWVASQLFCQTSLPIVRSIAVNGTPFPVDAERGIDPVIFYGTLDGLSETTLLRFYRRMCGSLADLERFMEKTPHRSLEELKEELECIGLQCAEMPESTFRWERAWVGTRDKIFLPSAQQQAWAPHTTVEWHEAEHYSEHCFKEVLQ